MDNKNAPTLYTVIYTESHPDRCQTFLGVFSSEEKAEAAIVEHMEIEKARFPRAYVARPCYSLHETLLDEPTRW